MPALDAALLCSSRAGSDINHNRITHVGRSRDHINHRTWHIPGIISASGIRSTASRWHFLWSRRSTDQATTAGSLHHLTTKQIFYQSSQYLISSFFASFSDSLPLPVAVAVVICLGVWAVEEGPLFTRVEEVMFFHIFVVSWRRRRSTFLTLGFHLFHLVIRPAKSWK